MCAKEYSNANNNDSFYGCVEGFTDHHNKSAPLFKEFVKNRESEFVMNALSAGFISTYVTDSYPLCYADDKVISMLGYERDEFEEKFKDGTSKLNYSDDLNKMRKIAETVKDKTDMFSVRTRWAKKDGSPIWIEYHAKMTTDSEGKSIFAAVVTDITELADYKSKAEEYEAARKLSEGFALKLQKRLMPREHTLNSFFSDHSIIWRPRYTVGGDMYFFQQFSKGAVLCVFDCTGYGIVGAVHSSLVISMLKEIVNEQNCDNPARIICELDNKLFEPDSECEREKSAGEQTGNCAMAVLFIGNDKTVISAGANIHIFICDGGEVTQIKGQKIRIGEGKAVCKENIKMAITTANYNNKFYIATDGLYDQICGNRPFGYKLFKEIILDAHEEKLSVITDKIISAFENLSAGNEQRDDLQIITFKP